MSPESKMLSYWDEQTKETKKISVKDFEDKLKDIIEILKRSAEKWRALENTISKVLKSPLHWKPE